MSLSVYKFISLSVYEFISLWVELKNYNLVTLKSLVTLSTCNLKPYNLVTS